MKTISRIFLFSLGAALTGFWLGGADAEAGVLERCGLGSPGGIFGLALGGAGARAAMIKRTVKCLQRQAPRDGSHGGGGRFVASTRPAPHRRRRRKSPPTGHHRILRRRQRRAARLSADPDRQIYDLRPAGLDIDHPDFHFPERRNRGRILQFPCMRAHSRLRAGSRWSFCDLRFAGGLGRHKPRNIYSWRAASGHQPVRGGCGDLLRLCPKLHGTRIPARQERRLHDHRCPRRLLHRNPRHQPVRRDHRGLLWSDSLLRRLHPLSHGSFTTIKTPGSVACGGGNIPIGVNPAGAVTGLTTDPTCSSSLGYLRTPEGTITTFGVPGAGTFEPMAINPAALITGWFFDSSGAHGS